MGALQESLWLNQLLGKDAEEAYWQLFAIKLAWKYERQRCWRGIPTAKLLMSLKNICMFSGLIVSMCHCSWSHKYSVTHCLGAAYHVLVAHQGSPDIKCQCVEIWKYAWANIHANKKSTAFLLWTWLGKGKVLKWIAKWGNRMKWQLPEYFFMTGKWKAIDLFLQIKYHDWFTLDLS
jgi:hypothetical protein